MLLIIHTRPFQTQTHIPIVACPCINRAACICDSNRPMLSAFCEQLLGNRARGVDLGIERDVAGRVALASAIEKGLQRWVGRLMDISGVCIYLTQSTPPPKK